MHRDLFVTSPLLRGQDVLTIQTRLHALDYMPGVLDGQYGPASEGAVKICQAVEGLVVDGVVGTATRAALLSPHAKHAPAQPKGTPGLKALTESVKHIGTKEKPPGSNRTPFGEWFGLDGVPWCAIYVSYCFEIGAGYQLGKGSTGGVYPGKGMAYVPSVEAWLRSSGQWLGRVTPQPGDIAIYNWDGGVPDHIGIVESSAGGGKFVAQEGNTSVGNNSDGGEVMRRERYLTQVDGFGRIHIPT